MTQFELWKIDNLNYMQGAVVFILVVAMLLTNGNDDFVTLIDRLAATSLLIYVSLLVCRFAVECSDKGFNYAFLWAFGVNTALLTGASIWY